MSRGVKLCGIHVGCRFCDCGDGEGVAPPGRPCHHCEGDIRCKKPAVRIKDGTPLCAEHDRIVRRGEEVLEEVLQGGKGEGQDFVTCRHCGRAFKGISPPHLIRIHHYDPEHPVQDYLARFRLRRSKSGDVLRRAKATQAATFARHGKLWTKERVLQEIRKRVRTGKPIYSAAALWSGSLYVEARRRFGSWGSAVEAAGIPYDEVRTRRAWTREKIVETLRADWASGKSVRHKAVNDRDPGLRGAALLRFGNWDNVLRAVGIDPDSIKPVAGARRITRGGRE